MNNKLFCAKEEIVLNSQYFFFKQKCIQLIQQQQQDAYTTVNLIVKFNNHTEILQVLSTMFNSL
jgi:hypothetical protein